MFLFSVLKRWKGSFKSTKITKLGSKIVVLCSHQNPFISLRLSIYISTLRFVWNVLLVKSKFKELKIKGRSDYFHKSLQVIS